MAHYSGPNFNKTGLVFSVDPRDRRNTPVLGCGNWNGAPGIKCAVSGVNTPFQNSVVVGGKTYYTVGAKTYPEGNYGTDGLGFLYQGIVNGYNTRGVSPSFYANRGMTMWVWNNDTNGWVPDSYFNGSNSNGYHTYDTWGGAETGFANNLVWFVRDYNIIKSSFPNCTYIIIGSHAADRYDAPTIQVLQSLGAPSYTTDWNPSPGRPEWILVGKPDLGPGNAYGWAHENFTVNAGEVAHLNMGLPVNRSTGSFVFDGTNDYLTIENTNNPLKSLTSDYTLLAWCNQSASQSGPHATVFCTDYAYRGGAKLMSWYHGGSGFWIANSNGTGDYMLSGPVMGGAGWKMMVGTRTTNGVIKLYIDDSLYSQDYGAPTGTTYMTNNSALIGAEYHSLGTASGYYGEIGLMQAYNRELSETEVAEIFNKTKGIYGR